MNYTKLFTEIKTASYKKTGDDVDYCIHVDSNEKQIKLLFQESSSSRDWEINLNFPAKVYKQQKSCLKAHRGFALAYKSANDKIMEELEGYMKVMDDYSVLIAGWSLGGALAVLAAEDFYFRFNKQAVLVTFGAPKVLFGSQSKFYLRDCISKCFQIANHNDLVTYLPPFPGYTHICLPKCWRVGEPLSFWKLLKPKIYHTNYDNPRIYQKTQKN